MIEPKSNSPDFFIKKLNQSGVAIIPINPERLALKIAVGKLPLARETITMEEDTVDGNVPRKKREIQISEPVPASKKGNKIKASSGNITKVVN